MNSADGSYNPDIANRRHTYAFQESVKAKDTRNEKSPQLITTEEPRGYYLKQCLSI